MKIINILFCLFLLMLNSCNSNDTNTKQTKSRSKRDLIPKEVTQEKPKSKEELLREKLSDDQKTQLGWLKTALTKAGEFDKFLGYDESKIKEALDHIKTELDKCNGNDEGKNTFKQTIQGFFNGGDINKFTSDVTSACDGN
ncbi:Mlp family lipoprotein [Borreliella burgdorferi]|uniref:Mlp family lipoprotein n=1 Tax=Borreliella burgdorferi TaxID=139 RepID=UPI001E4C74A5|nr:Mlp family lipoprotein [Borreliella burgdorferi]MCD2372076.1 Mlp family lipoprotein [Borreliella burgdorferi]MDO7256986.1 Mlp family lipoprotein [Borreliella burgdorferi]MDO7273083.1 Mlp family lipoprotein [Borreliella burgdorferi]MDO7279669.1 Mlp family lipoprotein [Borreliella burgdorferi]